MGIITKISVLLVAILLGLAVKKINTVPDLPDLDPSPWWGAGKAREQNENIRPFKIEIPQKVSPH